MLRSGTRLSDSIKLASRRTKRVQTRDQIVQFKVEWTNRSGSGRVTPCPQKLERPQGGRSYTSSMAENDELGIERTASIQNPSKPSSSLGARVRATHDDDDDDDEDEEATRALSVMDSFHQPWLTGVKLLDDANRNKHVLPTGLKGIDVLLGGGLREGQLIEIAGPSSSGKTQVCLHSASCIADKGTVMFLDTCNSFSPNRIAGIVNQFSGPLFKEVKTGGYKISLLIIDSISSLIAPILGGKSSQVNVQEGC